MMFVLVPSVPVKNEATGEELQPTDTTHLTDENVTEPPGPRGEWMGEKSGATSDQQT